jgi:Ca2+-binding EF-hand superfamily protein
MVTRHLCKCFDQNPRLRPERLQQVEFPGGHQISLSKAQHEQIEEIFNLFDIDGGGSIDKRELELAMVALGFHDKTRGGKDRNRAAAKMIADMVADGKVTLDEFSSLMMGQLNLHDPLEEVRAAFVVLSRSDGNDAFEGFITADKLQTTCQEFEVLQHHPLTYPRFDATLPFAEAHPGRTPILPTLLEGVVLEKALTIKRCAGENIG